MSNVISLKDHDSNKKKLIREAEKKAEWALLEASAAFRELHRLKGS